MRNTGAKQSSSFRVWQSAAVRQKERRLEAEEQHRRLKYAVTTRLELIRQLQDLMHQCAPERLTFDSGGSNTALFKNYARELDTLYAQSNNFISDLSVTMSSSPLKYSLMRRWNEDKTYLVSADATVIPFEYEHTCTAMSRLILSGLSGKHYNDEVDPAGNTAATICRMDFSKDLGDSATLLLHTVVRKYVEPNRVVFVWRTLTEGQGAFDGLHTDETVWYVVRHSTRAHEGTAMVLESYTRLVPVGFELSETDERGNAFVEILARADEEDVSDCRVGYRRV